LREQKIKRDSNLADQEFANYTPMMQQGKSRVAIGSLMLVA